MIQHSGSIRPKQEASVRTPCVVAALVVPLNVASATDPIVAVEFSDLRGVLTFAPGARGGTFTAGAVSDPGLLSSGVVWRADPAGEALFDTGFVGEPNPADAVLNLTLGEIRDKRADVFGSAQFTDVDGDTVKFVLTGTMSFDGGGQVVTNAVINSVEVESDEGFFDGSDGGSISTMGLDDARGVLTINFSYQFQQTGQGRVHVGPASLSGRLDGPRGVPSPAAGGLFACAAAVTLRRRRPTTAGVA